MSDDPPITHPATGADWAPSVAELMRTRDVAAGRARPDLIIRGGKVLALHTGEVLERDVVLAGRFIAAVTPVGHFEASSVIDARDAFVGPAARRPEAMSFETD